MNMSVSIDISAFNRAPIPPELSRVVKNSSVTLLERSLTGELFSDFLNYQTSPPPVYLTGPGGKSSILFMLASKALEHNKKHSTTHPIFLFYCPNSSQLATLSCEEAAIHLINMVKLLNSNVTIFKDLLTIDDTQSFLFNWNRLCNRLRLSTHLNLLLVDQWNAIIDATFLHEDHPLRRFRTIETRIGFSSQFIAAVSSSFSPLDSPTDTFRDAEAETAKQRIEPLSMDELLLLKNIWADRYPSITFDEVVIKALYKVTGGIPRLCEFFAVERAKRGVTTNDPDWIRLCTNHYVTRLRSIFDSIPLELRKSMQAELGSLYLRNRELPNANSLSESRWTSSGLLTTDPSKRYLVPVNLFVRKSIDNFVASGQTSLLKNLYADAATCWRAIELFTFLQLRTGGAKLLIGTNLRGDERSELHIAHNHLNVIDITLEFASDPVAYLQNHHNGNPFPVGTMLIPNWTCHPVADAVLFVTIDNLASPQIVFVQVSQSSYSEHSSKISDLLRVHRGWRFSVLESYRIAFGTSTDLNEERVLKGKLPPDVKYIYVTTSQTLMKKAVQYSGHNVFLMRQENLRKLDEAMWIEITSS